MISGLRTVLYVLGIAFGVTACGGGGGGSTTPTTPTIPAAPTVSSVSVSAPASSATTGESLQFSATAMMSNNSTQTVTSQATWSSSSTGVATVSTEGMVATVGAGEADIRASYQNVTGSARITVQVPPPTPAPPPTPPPPTPAPAPGSVCGTVKEQGTIITLPGTTVTAKDTSFSTSSDSQGRYCLTGLAPGRYTLRATRLGYDPTEVDVDVSGNVTADISMQRQSTPGPTPGP